MEKIEVLIIILLSLGAIQGIIYGFLLFFSRTDNVNANRILAVILWLLSYRLLIQVMRLFGIGYYDTWYYFMLDLSWVHGALLYLYVMAQINPQFQWDRGKLWHFLPLLLQITASVFVRIQNLYWDGTKDSLSWLGYWGYWLWMNQPTVYVVASLLIIGYAAQAESQLKHNTSQTQALRQKVQWMQKIVMAFKYYFILVLVILLGDLLWHQTMTDEGYYYFTRFYYYPFFIGISVLAYWLGIEGFRRMKIKKDRPALSPQKLEQLQQIADDFERLMSDEQLFLNPEINLTKTAEQLGVKRYMLSLALKEILKTNFNDALNAYRVEAFQALLKTPENQSQNLLTLAFKAGFNSKSSFNRAIKNRLGKDPKELKPGNDNE